MDDGTVELLEYNRWAMGTLLEHCRALPDAALDARLPGFSGPSRELFMHLVGAQQTFVLRTLGRQHEGELGRDSRWPGWGDLARLAEESSAALVEAARAFAPDAEVDLAYLGAAFRYPVRFFLAHAVAHGVEHRTEIKLQLGQQGLETPDLDGWPFAVARGYGAEAGVSRG